jgi:hypothetical protein
MDELPDPGDPDNDVVDASRPVSEAGEPTNGAVIVTHTEADT